MQTCTSKENYVMMFMIVLTAYFKKIVKAPQCPSLMDDEKNYDSFIQHNTWKLFLKYKLELNTLICKYFKAY